MSIREFLEQIRDVDQDYEIEICKDCEHCPVNLDGDEVFIDNVRKVVLIRYNHLRTNNQTLD